MSTAIYISRTHQRRGAGRALYSALFDLLRRLGYYKAIAGITLPNPASVGLHEAMGFELAGVYGDIGYKLGAWRDVAWYQACPHSRCRQNHRSRTRSRRCTEQRNGALLCERSGITDPGLADWGLVQLRARRQRMGRGEHRRSSQKAAEARVVGVGPHDVLRKKAAGGREAGSRIIAVMAGAPVRFNDGVEHRLARFDEKFEDLEKNLLDQSARRIHEFERRLEHEWIALRQLHEEPLKTFELRTTALVENCLQIVGEALVLVRSQAPREPRRIRDRTAGSRRLRNKGTREGQSPRCSWRWPR